MISDDTRAIGFKISESGPIYGAEGEPGKYLDPVTLRGQLIMSIQIIYRIIITTVITL